MYFPLHFPPGYKQIVLFFMMIILHLLLFTTIYINKLLVLLFNNYENFATQYLMSFCESSNIKCT